MKNTSMTIFILLGLLVFGIMITYELFILRELSNEPSSYSACLTTGGYITKDISDEICVTLHGQMFFNPEAKKTTLPKFGIQIDTPIPTRSRPPAKDGCHIGGCSNELCLEGSDTTTTGACDIQAHYVCYRNAICERQSDGICGWKNDSVLKSCLESYEKTSN